MLCLTFDTTIHIKVKQKLFCFIVLIKYTKKQRSETTINTICTFKFKRTRTSYTFVYANKESCLKRA